MMSHFLETLLRWQYLLLHYLALSELVELSAFAHHLIAFEELALMIAIKYRLSLLEDLMLLRLKR